MSTALAPRIGIEQVKEAYAKTGLRPVCGLTFERVPVKKDGISGEKIIGACPIGAIYLAENPDMPVHCLSFNTVVRWADERYGHEYVEDFMNGFDVSTCGISSNAYADGFELNKILRPIQIG